MAGFWDIAEKVVPGAKDAKKLKQKSTKADKERRQSSKNSNKKKKKK